MDLFDQIQNLVCPVTLPRTLLEVEQRFDAPQIALADIPTAVCRALEASGLLARVSPGDTVAVGAGSRGIANLALIVRAAVSALREAGARPFVTPAMGSHGGATAEGQREMLAGMGVTESGVGAEIRATMEVRQIGQIPGGPPLYQDVISAGADHTLLINRVKPHTDFHSDLESGLAKMELIGLGKHAGALAMHGWGMAGFRRFLAPAARIYEAHANIIGGLALLENARDETAVIEGLTVSAIGGPAETALLARAKALMGSLPFPAIDVLVVQRIGKNISGTGMDTNIIGRLQVPREPEGFGGPDVATIAVLDLTPESHGNALGMGLADVASARLARKIDWAATYTNGITSAIAGIPRASLPMILPHDRQALEVALRACGEQPEQARVVFIRDTLALDRLWISPSLRPAAESHPRLAITGEVPLSFDARGALLSPWRME